MILGSRGYKEKTAFGNNRLKDKHNSKHISYLSISITMMSVFTRGANTVGLSIACREENSYEEVQYWGLEDALSRQCHCSRL